MKIIIDDRENGLYERFKQLMDTQKTPLTTITLEKRVLPIGDVILQTENEDKTVCIIERKTLADLLASIKDGRYVEQSYRLANQTDCVLHNIIYVIEGNPNGLSNYAEKRLVYSAMASIQFFKGFSTIKTNSATETAEWILWSADKIERNLQKNDPSLFHPIWASGDGGDAAARAEGSGSDQQPTQQDYCSVVKKVKKENVTRENIGEIILCQIPGISSVTAIAIMSKFNNFIHLLDTLKQDPKCLDKIQYESKGKMRKISSSCIESIKQLLL